MIFRISLKPLVDEATNEKPLSSDFEIIESEEDISSLIDSQFSTPNKEMQFVTWSYDETQQTDWQAVTTGTSIDQFHHLCYRYDHRPTISTDDLESTILN